MASREQELIRRIAQRVGTIALPDEWELVEGIGDDTAVLRIPARASVGGEERRLLATVDMLVEGVHFRLDWTDPQSLGWKALAVNLSDIASMGGVPLSALLSLALPQERAGEWLDAFIEGFAECAHAYGCALIGGDTNRSHIVVIDVAVLGMVEGEPILRRGARPGDWLMVTGSLGASRAGLKVLMQQPSPQSLLPDADIPESSGDIPESSGDIPESSGDIPELSGDISESSGDIPESSGDISESSGDIPQSLGEGDGNYPNWEDAIRAHLRPTPRLREGIIARLAGVHAMMDISDGLASDLPKLLSASQVGAIIREGAIPVHPSAERWASQHGESPALFAIAGGEDYELLLSAPPSVALEILQRMPAETGTPLTVIGEVIAEQGLWLERVSGVREPLAVRGWEHFD